PDIHSDEILTAVDHLERASVLIHDPRRSTVSLYRLARAFADAQLSDGKDDPTRQLIQRAARYLAVYLAQQPDRESCLRLLKCAQQAQLSPDFQLELAYTFASLMESSGTWTAWASYLEPLLAITKGKDRLWLGLRSGVARRWL